MAHNKKLIPTHILMITFDITNLYSNVPQELGKQTILVLVLKIFKNTTPKV